jgi:hypothetical protein
VSATILHFQSHTPAPSVPELGGSCVVVELANVRRARLLAALVRRRLAAQWPRRPGPGHAA